MEYLIKWKNTEDLSWTAERDIVSKVAIEEYERKLMEAAATIAASVRISLVFRKLCSYSADWAHSVGQKSWFHYAICLFQALPKHERDIKVEQQPVDQMPVVKMEPKDDYENTAESESDPLLIKPNETGNAEQKYGTEVPCESALTAVVEPALAVGEPDMRSIQQEDAQHSMTQEHQKLLQVLAGDDESPPNGRQQQTARPNDTDAPVATPTTRKDSSMLNAPQPKPQSKSPPIAPSDQQPAGSEAQPQSKRRKTINDSADAGEGYSANFGSNVTAEQMDLYYRLVNGKEPESNMVVIDLVRILTTNIRKCLIKMNENKAWVPFDAVKQHYPLPLIKYYESRIQWTKVTK